MALQSFTVSIGALRDVNNNDKNYVSGEAIYVKTIGGSFAQIFRDLAGTSEIAQDGLANKTNESGQFTFFVEAGDYILEYQNQSTPVTIVGADYFNSRIEESVNQIIIDTATSRGFRVVGDFASGFTYELPNDVSIDDSGNYWVYADINALPVTVSAGTEPSEPTYTQVTFNQASGVTTTAGINTQQFIDNFELKIFQSPTDNLTKVSTFAGGVGVVYEVRKTSDNSLATIYSDAAGATEIVQNGTANVSNGDAEAVFYIAGGDYYVEVNSVQSNFEVNVLRQDLASPDSNVLVGGAPASAIAQSVKDKITISELVRGFGAAAWTQAVNYKTLVINESVAKSGQYIIPEGQTIIFENNAAVIQSDNLTAFIASNNEWHIMGAGFVLQSSLALPVSNVPTSRGILVSPTSFDWSITGNIRVMWFKGAGLEAGGGGILTGRTGYNQVSGLHCDKNWDNYRLLSGFPAEYTTFVNCRATYAANDGVYEEAGNINWAGGAIVYNNVGVHLKHPDNGANPHHGMFSGTNINHNKTHQLWSEIVAAGYDFIGCHFYDNGTPSEAGIFLDRCRGINITGGTIGCDIIPVTTGGFVGHVGYNRIAGNKIDRNRSVVTGVGFDRTKLFVEENFDNNGSWQFNDTARIFAQRYAGSAVPLTGQSGYAITGEVGGEILDNRNALGASYVMPFRATVKAEVLTTLTASSAFTNEYIWFARDDSASGSFTELYRINLADIADSTGLKAVINFSYEFLVSSGGQFNVFLSECGLAKTYTFSSGTLVTIKSNS